MDEQELSPVSEINILPDGRVYIFGPTPPLLEVLGALSDRNERVQQLLKAVRSGNSGIQDSVQ